MFVHSKWFQHTRSWIFFSIILICLLSLTFYAVYTQKLWPFFKQNPLCKDCNILLISLDTCGAKHMSTYGYSRNTTPNLEVLAKEGIFFTNVHSNATWTLPSHVSIFTGTYPFIHNQRKYQSDPLNPTLPFLPEILQQNGYETDFFMPNDNYSLPVDTVYNKGITKIISDGYHDRPQYVDTAMDLLDKNTKAHKKTFMFFHTYNCHAPYFTFSSPLLYATEKNPAIPLDYTVFDNPFTEGFYQYILKNLPLSLARNELRIAPEKIQIFLEQLQTAPNFTYAKHIFDNAMTQNMWGEYGFMDDFILNYHYWLHIDTQNPKDIAYITALYDQKLHETDETTVGAILTKLKSMNLQKNTVIIVTSDHGEEFMEHGELQHSTLYDPNTRVALVISVPGVKPTTVQEHVQSVDIAPTILQLVGIKNTYSFHGVSLVPLFNGISLGKRLIITNGYETTKVTVRDGDWKLFITELENGAVIPYELYNTKDDTEEKNNIIVSHIKKAEQMTNDYKIEKTKLLQQ